MCLFLDKIRQHIQTNTCFHCQKQTFRGPYKFNDRLHQNLTKRNININSVFNKFYVT